MALLFMLAALHWMLPMGDSWLAQAREDDCGVLTNPDGPADYRDPSAWKYGMPQGTNHFAPEVQNLIRGHAGTLLGDLDYTLRSYPNHPGALWAVSRYERRLHGQLPPERLFGGWRRTVECYFDRATRFRSDDGKVWQIWGMHLVAIHKPLEAKNKFDMAEKCGEDSADFYYSRGLLRVELKDYAGALTDAHKAASLGFPFPGLREQLQKAGRWQDAPANMPATPSVSTAENDGVRQAPASVQAVPQPPR